MRTSQRISALVTQLIAWAVKIVGLISATNQLLLVAHPTSLALVISGVMVAGGELSERIVLGFLDRLIGPPGEPAAKGGGSP